MTSGAGPVLSACPDAAELSAGVPLRARREYSLPFSPADLWRMTSVAILAPPPKDPQTSLTHVNECDSENFIKCYGLRKAFLFYNKDFRHLVDVSTLFDTILYAGRYFKLTLSPLAHYRLAPDRFGGNGESQWNLRDRPCRPKLPSSHKNRA